MSILNQQAADRVSEKRNAEAEEEHGLTLLQLHAIDRLCAEGKISYTERVRRLEQLYGESARAQFNSTNACWENVPKILERTMSVQRRKFKKLTE